MKRIQQYPPKPLNPLSLVLRLFWSSLEASAFPFCTPGLIVSVFAFGLSTEEGSSLEEIGFNWGEYLEETGASAAPHTSFKHVRSTPSLSALNWEGGRRVSRKMPNLVRKKGMRRKGKFSQDFLKIKKRWGNSFAFHR